MTDLNTVKQRIREAQDELKAAHKKVEDTMKAVGKEYLEKAYKAIFEKYPEIEAIGWTQYTPYFNDGDECVFSVHDIAIRLGDDEINEWYGVEYPAGYTYKGRNLDDLQWAEARNLFATMRDDVEAIRGELSEEALNMLFGDHCKVVITRRGIDVEEYSHD